MNKNQIAMCSIGGIALVAAAGLGYFIYSAYAERGEKLDELESAASAVQRINSSKISPEKASIDAIEENTKSLTVWSSEARTIAARGDEAVDATVTPEAFKRTLVDEARVESARPGGVEGKIVKEGFAFGFKDYISGGAMPERDRLAFLQRQWQDIKTVTRMLSDAGVIELADIVIGEKKAPAPEAEQPKRGQRGKKAEPEVKPQSDEQRYDIKFIARAPALVRVINAFATAERFITVDSFAFVRSEDTLGNALGEKGDKDAGAATGGRSRSGRGRGRGGFRAQAEAEAEAQAETDGAPRRKGLVIDPQTEAPFTVTMTITTHDFGTGEERAKERAEKAAAETPAEEQATAAAEEASPAPAEPEAAEPVAATADSTETTEREDD